MIEGLLLDGIQGQGGDAAVVQGEEPFPLPPAGAADPRLAGLQPAALGAEEAADEILLMVVFVPARFPEDG